MSFEAESNSELTDRSGIPVAFPICGAKQNTQTKHFVIHPDRHTCQYCRSLWFSARSVWWSDEFQKVCRIVGNAFGPVRFLLPVCRLSWFLYTLNMYAHFLSHFSQQLLMAEIWYFITIFILVCNIVGSVFGPVGFLLPVCRPSWFLYTVNIYAHFSQQLLMAEIWYLVTSFI
jgi:hypothetical protein